VLLTVLLAASVVSQLLITCLVLLLLLGLGLLLRLLLGWRIWHENFNRDIVIVEGGLVLLDLMFDLALDILEVVWLDCWSHWTLASRKCCPIHALWLGLSGMYSICLGRERLLHRGVLHEVVAAFFDEVGLGLNVASILVLFIFDGI